MGTQAPRMSQCHDVTRNRDTATAPPVKTEVVATGGSPAGGAAAPLLVGKQ